jgi:hypothetical protein
VRPARRPAGGRGRRRHVPSAVARTMQPAVRRRTRGPRTRLVVGTGHRSVVDIVRAYACRPCMPPATRGERPVCVRVAREGWTIIETTPPAFLIAKSSACHPLTTRLQWTKAASAHPPRSARWPYREFARMRPRTQAAALFPLRHKKTQRRAHQGTEKNRRRNSKMQKSRTLEITTRRLRLPSGGSDYARVTHAEHARFVGRNLQHEKQGRT